MVDDSRRDSGDIVQVALLPGGGDPLVVDFSSTLTIGGAWR